MINRQLVHYDTAGNRVIINPGEMTNTGGDNWDLTPSGYVPLTSVTPNDVPLTIPERDANCGFSVGNVQIDVLPPVAQTDGIAKIVYNDTDGTVQFLLKGGNVLMPVGEREVLRVRNADAAPMTAGQVVYLFGSTGSHSEVKLANASAESTSSGTIGVVAEPIAVNQEGYIITTGVLRNINTLALTQGAPVWLSTVSGQMTSTRPTAPNHGVVVGFCVRQHATVGAIYIRVDNGWELDELHNVYISGVANGDLLMYNGANSRWQNLPSASQPWVLKAGDTMTGTLYMNSAKIGVNTASPATAVQIAGTSTTDMLRADIGIDLNPVANPTSLTATLLAVAGNVNVGNHYYTVTFVTAIGETVPYRFGTTGRLVTTVAGSQQVQLTIPTSTDYRVIARRIYRSKAGGNYFDQYLVATINDNVTTSYTDNIADASLGTVNQFYRDNTTSRYITVYNNPYLIMGEATTALGQNAARNMIASPSTYTGGFNTCVGLEAGYNLTSATRIVAIGQNAGRGATTASDSIFIGGSAGESSNANSSVFIGRNAGVSGSSATVGIGANAAPNGGAYSVSIGNNSNFYATGSGNISLGYYTGNNLTTGTFNITMGAAVTAVSATGSNQLNIANTIYGTGIYGSSGVLSNTPAANGRIAIGLQTPTAILHLKAGTTSANTAPLKFSSGSLMTAAEAGAVEFLTDKAYLTITTGTARKEFTLNDATLTAGQQPTTTTDGRLTNSNKYSIYATGTTNGAAGSAVNLTIVPMPTNGELRFLRITVKALSAAAPPDSFGRTLDAMWANAAGVLTQVGADQLGTALTTGNLAAATIATTAAGTNVRVTCTDVTGCGAVVTWQVFGEYY